MSDKPVGSIYSKMIAVMAEIPSIGKDRDNPQQKYKFRGIDDVYNVLHPLLAKHGVFPMPEVLKEERDTVATKSGGTMMHTKVTVRYTFYADDGSSVSGTVIGEGMDVGDKSGNKAMSGAQKYNFLQVFCIPTNDPKDSEDETPEIAEPAKEPELSAKAIAEKLKTSDNIFHLKKRWAKYTQGIATRLTEGECAMLAKVKNDTKEKLQAAEDAKKNPDAEAIAKDAERGEGDQEQLIPDGNHPGEE